MKTSIKALLAIAVIGASSLAHGVILPATGSVTVEGTDYDGIVNVGGGEFKATIAGFGTFYTFCIESDENINLPGTYDYKLSDTVQPQNDPLSKGVAFLYELYVKGQLYARTLDAAHDLAAGQLQTAIWILEDGVGYNPVYVAGNPYLALAVSEFGSLANAKANDTTGRVKVMNLSIGQETYQDILVFVPDSGTTVVLLGLGLASLAMIRRRR